MQRVEIITGRARRRRWSLEETAQLVAEAFAPGALISHVARRHDVAESCLYAWRKQLNGCAKAEPGHDTPLLIPVTLPAPEAGAGADGAVVTLPDATRLELSAGYPAHTLQTLIAALRSQP